METGNGKNTINNTLSSKQGMFQSLELPADTQPNDFESILKS